MLDASRHDHLVATAGVAIVCNALILQPVGPWLLQSLFGGRFACLPASKQQWLSKLTMSVMSSAVVGTTAVMTHLYEEHLDPAHLRHDIPVVRYNCAFMLGHTIADTLAIALFRPSTQTNYLQLLVHHVITLIASFIGTFNSSLPYYTNVALMMEVSTVFYCSGIVLRELGYPKLYLAIYVFFAVTFFSVRIILGFLIFWYHMIPLLQTAEFYRLGLPVLTASLGCMPAFQLLNLVWFPMLCQRLLQECRVQTKTVDYAVRDSKTA